MKQHTIGLYWFTNDLRLTDNELLVKAQQECQKLIYCYVKTPNSVATSRYGIAPLGEHRRQFIDYSLQEIATKLAQHGHSLLVLTGEPLEQITQCISQYGIDVVYQAQSAGVYEKRRWQQLQRRFPFIQFEQAAVTTLFSEAELPFSLTQLPQTFSQFRKAFEPLSANLPKKPLQPLDYNRLSAAHIDAQQATDLFIAPGQDAAEQHLKNYFSHDYASHYKDTRNALDGFYHSTKFSAYLAQGNLSPQRIINALRDYEQEHGDNESTYWITFELMWREYFFWYLQRYQEQVFAFKGIQNKKLHTSFYPARFNQWCCGNTPYPLVNALMKQLNATGYMSNRGRQIAASCLVNELGVDWRYGAAYFEQQLIDYDIGSNWGNWQYIAGVGADPRGGRHFNIDKQTQQFDPDHEFIHRWNGHQTTAIDHTDAADWPIA